MCARTVGGRTERGRISISSGSTSAPVIYVTSYVTQARYDHSRRLRLPRSRGWNPGGYVYAFQTHTLKRKTPSGHCGGFFALRNRQSGTEPVANPLTPALFLQPCRYVCFHWRIRCPRKQSPGVELSREWNALSRAARKLLGNAVRGFFQGGSIGKISDHFVGTQYSADIAADFEMMGSGSSNRGDGDSKRLSQMRGKRTQVELISDR